MAQALEEVRKQREEFQQQVGPGGCPHLSPRQGQPTSPSVQGRAWTQGSGRWKKNVRKKPPPHRIAFKNFDGQL